MTLTAPFVRSLSACLQLGLVCGIESGSSDSSGSFYSLGPETGSADCTAPSWLANFVAFSTRLSKSQSKSQINRFIELIHFGLGPGLPPFGFYLTSILFHFIFFYLILFRVFEQQKIATILYGPQVFRCVLSSEFLAVSLFAHCVCPLVLHYFCVA